MIGNQMLEESIACTAAPVCYQHLVLMPLQDLAATATEEAKQYSICVFDCAQRLDVAKPLAQVTLAHKPLCLAIDGAFAAVYSSNHHLHVLHLLMDEAGAVRLKQLARINLANTFLQFPPHEMQSLSISRYSQMEQQSRSYPATCVFHHNGNVSCLSLEPAAAGLGQLQLADAGFLLAQDVDRVWLPSDTGTSVLSSSMWFACGRQGVKVGWVSVAASYWLCICVVGCAWLAVLMA